MVEVIQNCGRKVLMRGEVMQLTSSEEHAVQQYRQKIEKEATLHRN